jgi:hypothetical protein
MLEGGGLNYLDEDGGVLKINVQYLVFISHRPPPLPLLMNGPLCIDYIQISKEIE